MIVINTRKMNVVTTAITPKKKKISQQRRNQRNTHSHIVMDNIEEARKKSTLALTLAKL